MDDFIFNQSDLLLFLLLFRLDSGWSLRSVRSAATSGNLFFVNTRCFALVSFFFSTENFHRPSGNQQKNDDLPLRWMVRHSSYGTESCSPIVAEHNVQNIHWLLDWFHTSKVPRSPNRPELDNTDIEKTRVWIHFTLLYFFGIRARTLYSLLLLVVIQFTIF